MVSIIPLEAFELLTKSDKETFCKKEIGSIPIEPVDIEEIEIEVSLPYNTYCSNNCHHYLSKEILKNYYKHNGRWGYRLKDEYVSHKNCKPLPSVPKYKITVKKYIYTREQIEQYIFNSKTYGVIKDFMNKIGE